MKIQPFEFGTEKNRLVVIDDFLPEAERAVEVAARIQPFAPEQATAYPGVRHQLTPDQKDGAAYVRGVLTTAGPIIAKMYGARSYTVLEASFSIVTRRPEELTAVQRRPHIDSFNVMQIAILHHLHHLPNTGTAFYRHRRTGYEKASDERRSELEAAWEQDDVEFGESEKAFAGESDARFEKIFAMEGRFNRLLIYQGALFHSGIVPADFAYDPNPRTGRLTSVISITLAG